MKQLPQDHPLRAKIAAAEERAKENTANAEKLATVRTKKRAAINSRVKRGVALQGKI